MEEQGKLFQAISKKIPPDKMILVPLLIMMIDPKTWKFPEGPRTKEFQEIIDVIENCEELKEIFGTK